MQRKALVFSGQGTQRKGMCASALVNKGALILWERMKNCMMQNYGVSLQDVINENPLKMSIYEDALNIEKVLRHSCTEVQNTPESTPRSCSVQNPNGVMSFTYITQPCVVAAQLLTIESLKDISAFDINSYSMIAGHSLGEFTALCTLGVFSPETALNLTFKRGLLMEKVFENYCRGRHLMYACNVSRAKLHEDTEMAVHLFYILVELIARSLSHTTSFLEIANFNLLSQQYVVAGDTVALSVLGKSLDPQFRANCPHCDTLDGIVRDALASVRLNGAEGITYNPLQEKKPQAFATAAYKKYGNKVLFKRFLDGPDDGYTPSLEKLSHLEAEDCSGLKRKLWFIPLSVEIPFHTSKLRQCSDHFLSVVREALPQEDILRSLLSVDILESHYQKPLWVTNLTGSVFKPFDAGFQAEVREAISSLNIGEIQHKGRYSDNVALSVFENGIRHGSVVDICAAILAAQLSHPVMWIDVMNKIVIDGGCHEIVEISPIRIISDLFERSTFTTESGCLIKIRTKSYPTDIFRK